MEKPQAPSAQNKLGPKCDSGRGTIWPPRRIGALFTIIFCLGSTAFANVDDGLVDLHLAIQPKDRYIQKPTLLSYRFGVEYESFLPVNYGGGYYTTNYGSSNPIPMISAYLGLQWNTQIGALYADFIGGSGTGAANSSTYTFALSKVGGQFGFILDRFANNPWLVPYAALQIIQMTYNDSNPQSVVAGVTSFAPAVVVGVSLPLSVIDPASSGDIFREYGVKNVFFDLHAIEYMAASGGADFSTDWTLGAGLHFEF